MQIGDSNRNGQILIEKTEKLSTTHYNQRIWALQCSKCGLVYGANGCDAFQRKCPKCGKGKAGEPLV